MQKTRVLVARRMLSRNRASEPRLYEINGIYPLKDLLLMLPTTKYIREIDPHLISPRYGIPKLLYLGRITSNNKRLIEGHDVYRTDVLEQPDGFYEIFIENNELKYKPILMDHGLPEIFAHDHYGDVTNEFIWAGFDTKGMVVIIKSVLKAKVLKDRLGQIREAIDAALGKNAWVEVQNKLKVNIVEDKLKLTFSHRFYGRKEYYIDLRTGKRNFCIVGLGNEDPDFTKADHVARFLVTTYVEETGMLGTSIRQGEDVSDAGAFPA